MMRARELKTRELENIKELISKYDTIAIGDLTNLPSSTLQRLRKKLQDKMFVRVTKKSLISLAIEQSNKNLSGLQQSLENSIPVLILSNEDPFKLFKLIKENKSSAFAKPNQLSPRDIIIPAGPTNFPPGPIIGELGAIGLQTGVEQGKITIKKEKLIVKENEIIKQEVASVLAKLDIKPIEIGLNLVSVYKDNIIYNRDLLDVDEAKYLEELRLANSQAFLLAEKIGFISRENVKILLQKDYLLALRIGKKLNIEVNTEIKQKEHRKEEVQVKEEVKEHKKEEQSFVGYKEDSVKKAQELLRELQDKKIAEQEKPKHKSMWD
ncbi:MAG: 50S ribosomal protein L10 [Nanoarchaeota archaeon]